MGKRNRGRMGSLGDKAFDKTDREFADREAEILLNTAVDWERLRPKVNNSKLYDRLMAVVSEATERNEDAARLKSRIKQLGEEGMQMARRVIELTI